jgi:HEAT repeat protein
VGESGGRGPQEGDELWVGLIGPIRVSDEMTPEREAANKAGRVAQAAHSLDDLVSLVRSHPNPLVRRQAIPRLRARFPDEPRTLLALRAASTDEDARVRDIAVRELGDVKDPSAAEFIAARLGDVDFQVRLSAAQTLTFIGDARAPTDPEAWTLSGMLTEGE